MLPLSDEIKYINNFLFISFDNGCVLFNETEQSVLILNQTAAFIWCNSFEVDSFEELTGFVARKFNISLDVAREDIKRFFSSFKKSELFLQKEPDFGSFLTPVKIHSQFKSVNNYNKLYLAIGDNLFNVLIDSPVLSEELSRIFTHFICSSEAIFSSDTILIEVTGVPGQDSDSDSQYFSISVAGTCVMAEMLFQEVIPYLFGVIFETSFTTIRNGFQHLMFHAAVLSKVPGKSVLFPGEPGSGKSTLAAVLATKGWQFYTDELAVIKPLEQNVTSHPFPICIKDAAVEFLSSYYPKLDDFMRHHRLDDKWVRYLTVDKPDLSSDSHSVDIVAIVFPRYDQKEFCKLEVLDKAEALKRFLECGSSGRSISFDELSLVIKMIEEIACYSLVYSDINAAIKQLEQEIAR